jgi:hypothetical protein
MIKLITPPGMLLTVALLVIYSVYAFLIGSIEKSWVLLAGCGTAIVASYGTAMLRPWSQYLVYLLAVGFTAKLGQSIYAGVVSGYFDFQFGSVSESLQAVVPSTMMVLLSCVCCLLVFRHFRGARETGAGIATPAGIDQSTDAHGLPK